MAAADGDNAGVVVTNLNICLIVFSTVFIALRVYVRGFMIKAIGYDDVFAVIAWMFLIAQSALEIPEITNGSGENIQDLTNEQLTRFFIFLPTMEMVYFVAMCFVRLSIVAILPRLSKEKKVMRITYVLGAIVIIQSIICFCIQLFECKHIPDLWIISNPNRDCISQHVETLVFATHGAIGIVIDVTLLVIPIWLIYSRMMFSMATIKVLLVFGVGLFVIVTGIVRLVIILTTDFTVDPTSKLPRLSIWADLEGHIGLWVACFPTLPPLIRKVGKQVGLRSKTQSNSTPIPKSAAWDSKSRGYVQSGPEVNLRNESGSVFDDDSSTKKIVMVDERDVGMELGHVHAPMAGR